jgi:ATP-dependent RNA helicase SUPV3L1/SUV3
VGPFAVPVEALEQLDEALRAAWKPAGAALSEEARATLAWSEAEARQILKALDFTSVGRPKPGEPQLWRARKRAAPDAPPKREGHSPFAALAALKPAPERPAERPARKARRRPRRKAAGKASGGANP